MKKQTEIKGICRDCKFSYDPFNKGANGNILCKCRHSEYAKLINHDNCEKFEK